VLCFDLTKVETMHHLADWYKHIMDYAPEDIKLVICGTKCDMVDRREVSRAEAEEFAATLRCPYFETSSMTGEGVDKAFLELVRLSVEGEKGDKRSGADSKAAGSRVTVDDKNRGANGSGNKKKGCC
jgi:GTPase SAR1 family protein